MPSIRGVVCAAGAALLAGATTVNAQQRTLQFDLNDLAYQFMNAGGAAAPFPGVTATGSLVFGPSLISARSAS